MDKSFLENENVSTNKIQDDTNDFAQKEKMKKS